MERSFLEKFYTECGREVSLAYNVLNQTNSWGITIVIAVLATSLFSALKLNGSSWHFLYPTIVHWYIVIVSWIIVLRFFVRSALGLVNMYRWNELIYSTFKVLYLPDNHPNRDLFERNLIKKIDAYYLRWLSPKPRRKIIWQNLKLMYFWFFIIILGLFIWGIICLSRDVSYYLGLLLFIIPTLIEIVWYIRWYGMKFEHIELEPEPQIFQLIENKASVIGKSDQRDLLFGFCKSGPYRHAYELVVNPTVRWITWSYHIESIDSSLAKHLFENMEFYGRKVYFACWDIGFKGEVTPIRSGHIDHYVFKNNVLRVNVNLSDLNESLEKIIIKIDNSKIFCKYI